MSTSFKKSPRSFADMKITVMGLGLFGGGAGVTRFLVREGAKVTVTDLRSSDDLKRGLEQILDLPVRKVLGEHRQKDFTEADLIIANPAVPPDSPYLEMARAHNVPIESEMNLCLERLKGNRVAGVTGSNGKTTTSHLLYRIMKGAGERAWLGGNVGGSLLPEISEIRPGDFVILELSSFQLEKTGPRGLGPDVAVVTNLTPNHLDRHGSFTAYAEAKAQIFARARGAVLNRDDETSMERMGSLPIRTLCFSSQREVEEGMFLRNGWIVERFGGREQVLLSVRDVRLPGVFNLENIMAALAAARLLLDEEALPKAAVAAAAAFNGVSHRLEAVATRNGVHYINDSIATTPVSCMAALDAVGGEIHLIAGGYDKGLDLREMAEAVNRKVKSLFLVGATAEKLERAVLAAAARSGVALPLLDRVESLESGVKAATRVASQGATVLLSPGFASWDQFLNFEERGECFKRYVADLTV